MPLHQEHRILTTGLPGKSLRRHLESDLLLWFDSSLSSSIPVVDCQQIVLKKKKSRHSSLPQNMVPSLIEGAFVSGEVESMGCDPACAVVRVHGSDSGLC